MDHDPTNGDWFWAFPLQVEIRQIERATMSLRVPCKKQLAKGPMRQTHNLCIVIQCCRYVAAGKESASQFDPTYISYSSLLIKTKEDNLYVFHNQGTSQFIRIPLWWWHQSHILCDSNFYTRMWYMPSKKYCFTWNI